VRGERKVVAVCIIFTAGGLLSIIPSGCSSHPAGFAAAGIMTKSADWPYSVEVIERSDGTKDYYWEIESHIEQSEHTSIKYHQMNKQYKFAVVEGSLGQDGRKYPVVVDTGASQPVLVKNVHVRQNNLRVQTLKTSALGGRKIGLCYLPELDLSTIRLIDWPCLRLASQSAGLGVRDDFVIVGLPVLREFKYVVFDNIDGQIEFSPDKVFEPDEADTWEQFPMWLEEDFSGNVFLFARITVDGIEMELQLDTGSGRGLAISEELWEQIPEDKQVRLRSAKELYPYIGNLNCRRGTVAELSLGNSKVHNVPVSVFADDSPLVEDCGGLMGMELFRNTIIVIDFENELLWVKRS
jgi:predicted aspartyl protease